MSMTDCPRIDDLTVSQRCPDCGEYHWGSARKYLELARAEGERRTAADPHWQDPPPWGTHVEELRHWLRTTTPYWWAHPRMPQPEGEDA